MSINNNNNIDSLLSSLKTKIKEYFLETLTYENLLNFLNIFQF